ncbi:bifunctional diguanylate cyclase/phosphodiesterase [Metarhizobium album]|uniref:Bifunctional diguanylate cyclase/phosphodiesterase n=1 Tax=Metarhizobium album TaxID=2182425 RepID=A0A2U2DH75_9HYPH|nr:EAL domain-containing protein [Rhizobium album]PWE52675.1 bifunctional diguanylate cyclase/phosphodiesterase [Rhizobium album]
MLQVFSCIVTDHDLRYIAAAVAVCVLGCMLTIRLFSRARRTTGLQRLNWLFLTGTMGGATTWTTHFLSMLGYLPEVTSSYDPSVTLVSLFLAVSTAMIGFGLATYGRRSMFVEAGGGIIGLGIAAMHYTGMSAYMVQGVVEYDRGFAIASIILGTLFGVLATNRVVRPSTRFCRYGAIAALVAAIASTHFTGMASLNVVFDPRVVEPTELLSTYFMSFGVTAITLLLLSLGASTYAIDSQTNMAAVARYRHLSLHDPLTNLPNRAAFNEHLATVLENCRLDDTARFVVLSFDLDRFKEINDVHGHSAGDAVLRTIAERTSQCLADGEFLARMGGDEFVAIKQQCYSRTEAAAMAHRLLDQIARPIAWNNQVFSVSSSVGIATYPLDGKTLDDLMAQSDVAMYRAKNTASGSVCFYDASMDFAARERNALAIEMRHGIEKGEFELFYQQQNDTVSREIIGFEVLLRWRHGQRGMITPGDFIPIAESTGFILELGEWVLRMACIEAAGWKNPLKIAVNVAAQQIADPRFPAMVHQILIDSGLAPSRLELEITESGIVADQQRALHAIRQLKTLGVKIAMDDYGTGYSSLSTLQSFPFDKIKIDRAFVDGVETNRQSAAIIRSTLILAASLDIPVLAEGVETEQHIDFLRNEGCLQVQGYLFGRPTPRSEIEHVVNAVPPLSDTSAEARPIVEASRVPADEDGKHTPSRFAASA